MYIVDKFTRYRYRVHGQYRAQAFWKSEDKSFVQRSPSRRRADGECETFLLTFSVVLSRASSVALAADSAECFTVSLPITRLSFAAVFTDAGLRSTSYLGQRKRTRAGEKEETPLLYMWGKIIQGEREPAVEIYRGSARRRRSLRHASFAHARSASSQRSWPAMPIASSTGSRGGPPCFPSPPPPPGSPGSDRRNRRADAATTRRTTTATMAAAVRLAAGRAASSASTAAPSLAARLLCLPPLINCTLKAGSRSQMVIEEGRSLVVASPARAPPHGDWPGAFFVRADDTSGDTCWAEAPERAYVSRHVGCCLVKKRADQANQPIAHTQHNGVDRRTLVRNAGRNLKATGCTHDPAVGQSVTRQSSENAYANAAGLSRAEISAIGTTRPDLPTQWPR